ncbi:tannase and feruloyl esterase [Mycena polygramma]|nr:tannase and feruloyl esterase [Mycena polygramma]
MWLPMNFPGAPGFEFFSLLLTTFWNLGKHHTACLSLKSSLNLENTTVRDVSYVSAGTQGASVSLCRVQFSTRTSDTSSVDAEAWLPDEWHGRFLGVGNGGLGGYIDYEGLHYGASLHFATVGSNNGHDGDNGEVFLGRPEVINDFAFRAIHVEAVIGKQIVAAYYGRAHDKAYYLGCSTGGRQGTQAALKYPADFDGIIAGAPATDWNHLLHWALMLARNIGAPDPASSPAFIPPGLWKVVAAEVMRQCDALDGVLDGIITEPDDCDFRPEALLCGAGGKHGACLSQPQVDALRKIYAPLHRTDGELLYPRFDPGAHSYNIFAGQFSPIATDWVRYAVLNLTTFDLRDYGAKHLALMDRINPGGIATFDGDLSAFRDRGGKFLTYHGRVDTLIASGNSKRMYDLVAHTLDTPSLDAFYRLFLVPGMGHCTGGGAWRFGQYGRASSAVNASSHNLLLALVDWVEGGVAPDAMVGSDDGGATRVHCRYPMRSVWDEGEGAFGCVV